MFFVTGLPAYLATPFPTNGGARGSEYIGHHIRQEKPSACLLLVLAQVEDLAHRWTLRCEF